MKIKINFNLENEFMNYIKKIKETFRDCVYLSILDFKINIKKRSNYAFLDKIIINIKKKNNYNLLDKFAHYMKKIFNLKNCFNNSLKSLENL